MRVDEDDAQRHPELRLGEKVPPQWGQLQSPTRRAGNPHGDGAHGLRAVLSGMFAQHPRV